MKVKYEKLTASLRVNLQLNPVSLFYTSQSLPATVWEFDERWRRKKRCRGLAIETIAKKYPNDADSFMTLQWHGKQEKLNIKQETLF